MLLICLLITTACVPRSSQGVIAAIPDESILDIPTYDGSGQAVHPDILYFENGFRGKSRFYLAMTPYPNSNDNYENPSILVSDNGYDFVEEKPDLNPIVGSPDRDHNADPDIFFDADTQQFLLYYLEFQRPFFVNLMLLRSTDGIGWSKDVAVHYDLTAGDRPMVSPSLVKREGTYYLFFVSLDGYRIQYYRSSDGLNWDKNVTGEISIDFPDGFTPWHVDVFEGNGQFYMVCNALSEQYLYLARSRDLINWELYSEPVVKGSPSFHNSKRIYRSTAIVDGDTLVVWFSFETLDRTWAIGVKKRLLSDLF